VSLQPIWITADAPPDTFPDIDHALTRPNGLLAVGGDLRPERLVCAYRKGIFPWYSAGQPILWWSPDPRSVLFPERMRVSRSLRRTLRRGRFRVTVDREFGAVVAACARRRPGRPETWITAEMDDAYRHLHRLGAAHSLECWADGALAGGLYGVAIGRVFFGESMFSEADDASKVALVALCRLGYRLIDCQLPSAHLHRLGAEDIPRHSFAALLARWCPEPPPALPHDAREPES
jgi:leucyl/phenylalanyl-tRNA---protein transferase